jgi:hypothetical protein
MPTPQRTEPRLSKEASIRIFGMDSRGRPINQPAKTVDISQHGARVNGIKCWDYPGETVGIRYGMEKARYRVVWVGLPGTPVDGQIGVVCVETGKYIWDVSPPAAHASPGNLAAPIPSVPRMMGTQIGLAPVIREYEDSRRKDHRFVVTGGAHIREVGKNVPQWTTMHDLSMGGCYVETTAPLPIHTRVDLTIQVGDIKIDSRGSVTVKHPLVGMGIKFMEMSPLNRDRLRHLVGSLEQAEARASGQSY